MTSQGDPHAAPTAIVGTVFSLLFIFIVILLHAYYGRVNAREVQRKVIDEPAVDVSRAKAEQLQKIGEYRLIDAENGVVAIPIERAMELIVAERGTARAPAASEGKP